MRQRRGEQGAGDRHALAFATGELAGRAVEQVFDAEQFGDFGEGEVALAGRRALFAELHVAAH